MPLARSKRPLHRKPARSRLVTAVLALSLPALVVAVAAAPNASAAKGGGGKPSAGSSSGSVTVRLVDATDTTLNYGDTVTFDVSTTATTQPAVQLDCYQGGTLVMTSSAGFYPEWPWSKNFTLRSGAWTGGAADCTARLYKTSSNGLRTYTLATTSFHVDT